MFGGSHARGSKIRPVLGRQGDVDIYVVLKGDERNYGGLLQPPPAKLLADVKKTLDRYLKTPKVRADSPAVRITYDDMIVDVVPAFARFLSDAFDIPYYKTWMVATPRAQQRVFKQLDDARGGKFKPLLRMLKHWKAVHHTIGLRSYHLETLAYEVFRKREIDDYRHALYTFFDEARSAVQYRWNDPGGSGNAVTDYLTSATVNRASLMFKRAAERAARAIDAPTWRQEIAIAPRCCSARASPPMRARESGSTHHGGNDDRDRLPLHEPDELRAGDLLRQPQLRARHSSDSRRRCRGHFDHR